MSLLDDDNLWDDPVAPEVSHGAKRHLPGKVDRLIHFLIDMSLVTFLYYVFSFLLVINPLSANRSITLPDYDVRIVVIGLYVLYTLIISLVTGGRTLGNYVTGCRCFTAKGETPDVGKLFIRSITRVIPIDPISIFFRRDGKMWHDLISGTELRKSASR